MGMFCRHNRLTANCPICKKEMADELKASLPPTSGKRAARTSSAPRRPASHRAGAVVTKRLARAADDGYRNDLVPGIKATEDAERLAAALALSAARLDFPGPHPAVAEEEDPERASWLAFLLALAGPDRPELQAVITETRPDWTQDVDDLGPAAARTAAAYRAWAERAGSQFTAFSGDASWSPQRRFARVFDRLALPGFGRDRRYELLVTLGAAGTYDLEGDALHVGGHDDPTVLGATRALNSGDTMLLERRAAALAEATGQPIATLDRAFALWETGADISDAPDDDRRAAARAGLRLH